MRGGRLTGIEPGDVSVDSGAINWTVVSVGIALGGLILAAIRDSRVTARELRADMRDIRADIRVLSDRLDKGINEQDAKLERLAERLSRQEQEQARMNGVLETLPERLGRLEQEQARMNGMLETIRAGLSYRVERADAGDRVAEASESYESQE